MHGLRIKINNRLLVQADHACSGKLGSVGGGSSVNRCVNDNSNAEFFGSVMSHGKVESTYEYLAEQLEKLVNCLTPLVDADLRKRSEGFESRPWDVVTAERYALLRTVGIVSCGGSTV